MPSLIELAVSALIFAGALAVVAGAYRIFKGN